MLWLLLLPLLLTGAFLLTGWAYSRMQRAVRPRVCLHTHYIFGRCVECGTPL
jgi:hypothetical protein